jgi:alkyl hydroperoxide reductase subunit F
MKAIANAVPVEIKGDGFVTSLSYKISGFDETIELPVEAVFVEIGHVPATGFASGLVEMDGINRIKIDHKSQRTSVSGIWAAGDCTDTLYHQNNIAAGDAVKAIEDIYLWLRMSV